MKRNKIPSHWIGNSFHFQWHNDVPVIAFGPHRGKDLAYVAKKHPGFLSWIEETNMFPQHVTLVASQALRLDGPELKTWIKESFWIN